MSTLSYSHFYAIELAGQHKRPLLLQRNMQKRGKGEKIIIKKNKKK
jgi:hypothetical protein